MSLRPRYSLLSLLILTALVAGGVKLWYGPHHVVELVEEEGSMVEREYTFTRNWRGDKIVQGPVLDRYSDEDGKLSLVNLTYYRQGTEVCYPNSRKYSLCYAFQVKDPSLLLFILKPTISDNPLTPLEQTEFTATIERERQRIADLKPDKKPMEGYLPFR